MIKIWDDGRSGAAGQAAGNVALEVIQRSEGHVQKLKGTVFESDRSILIGRVCSSDEYLADPVLHWANASWDQHEEIRRHAKESGKAFAYLFVTVSKNPIALKFWKVPADVVEKVFVERERNRRGSTCAIHINGSGARRFIGKTDVTKYQVDVALRPAHAACLTESFNREQPDRREASASQRQTREHVAHAEQSSNAYRIPVSGGRSLTIQVPGPLSNEDVTRVKAWIDLTADVLTEGAIDAQAAREREWLRAKVQEGLEELKDGREIDGEATFARILSRRKRAGSTR